MNAADPEFDVCVIGSSNLDLVATTARLPRPGETVLGDSYAEHAGGKGLNQAVAAARSGARTAFVSAVGADPAGDQLLAVMAAESIATRHVRRHADIVTGRALIGVAHGGENSIIVVPGANATVTGHDIPTARVVLAQLEVPLGAIIAAFRSAADRGAITVLNPAPARELPAELLRLCDIVVPNELEAEVLGGVAQLTEFGATSVLVTLGSDGAMLHDASGVTPIDPYAVSSIDTTAAGDTFCGALCARLAAGDRLIDAARFASAAAAFSTTRSGAVPSIPTAAEVDRFLQGDG